ncbi:ATP/cobalamin adenosyltransferase [mine drainage metagenome]|uniref:ATP/cobalamin adenosyltransferase n=2 Tax=mine drainage metagenome TaxID=410659 RepID=T0Z1D7_9ZZZZ
MFTRKGDRGDTDSGRSNRVSKGSLEVEVEGLVDESSTTIGLALVKSRWDDITADLSRCQDMIFNMGEHILIEGKGRVVSSDDVKWVEERTTKYRDEVGKILLFVEPGGSEEAVILHLARVTVRNMERHIVALSAEKVLDPVIMQFANRLSSLLFMMALVANRRLGKNERIWELRKASG